MFSGGSCPRGEVVLEGGYPRGGYPGSMSRVVSGYVYIRYACLKIKLSSGHAIAL